MWIELLCGLVLYKIIRFFYGTDDTLDVESSDFNALFSVASRLEKLYGGKVYVGLRLPDPDSGSHHTLDLVLLTHREVVVICVKNMGGFVTLNRDGSWLCINDRTHKEDHLPNPVPEAEKQAAVLQSYLEQRGVTLPQPSVSYKVITSNPKFRSLNPDTFPPQVIQYDQWVQLKPEATGMLSGWIKGAFRSTNNHIQEPIHQQLHFVLTTAPMWDRLELKGTKYVLGEFVEFKGKNDDIQALHNIKRSKVGRLIVQKTSMFGLAPTRLQVLYSPRDYRTEGASASEWKEVTVRSSTEILLQPLNSKKVRKFKLSVVTSLTLSA